MLKYVCVFALLVGLAVAVDDVFKWDTIPIAENASQCIFNPEVKRISCRGPSGIVECPAVIELTTPRTFKFDVFGLRRDSVKSFVTPVETRRYELYPRKLDNVTYLNYTVTIGEKPVELYVYYGEHTTESGLRFTDKKCFLSFVDVVVDKSTLKHEVTLESGTVVELFGEVLVAEKPPSKRWLGFGFPWLGMGMGWGWGMGWGLPLWGMGLWG